MITFTQSASRCLPAHHVSGSLRVVLSMTLLCAFVLCPHLGWAQSSPPATIFYPRESHPWEWRNALGLRLLTVPRAIAEEEINKAPSLDWYSAVGLPWNFRFDTQVNTQYITNLMQAGFEWGYEHGPWGIGVGYDVAWWFGTMDLEGFDNSMEGLIHCPSISLGYTIDRVNITMKGEGMYIASSSLRIGEREVSEGRNVWSGASLSLILEQNFWKDVRVFLGAKVSVTKFHHQTWFAFSTFDRSLPFSELLFGFVL